jgi:hypothetical protein
VGVKLSLWLSIEVIFNIYPSTATTSLALLCSHLILLGALYWVPTGEHAETVKNVEAFKERD